MTEQHRAVFGPKVEMPQPKLRVYRYEEFRDFRPPLFGDAHFEPGGDMQRLEVFSPGEAEMVIAPTARDG